MSFSNKFDVDKVCRTCLQARELKSLYEACSTTELCFAEMLASCTPLKCYENDGLPKQICQICARALNQSYTFQLKCLEIDKMLRITLENIVKIEEEETMIDERKIVGKRECEQCSSDEINSNCSDCSCISIESSTLQKNPLKFSESQEELEVVKHEIEEIVNIKTEEDISASHLKMVNISEILNGSANTANDMSLSFIQKESRKTSYPCSVCEKAFNSKTDRTRHLRTHTGEKPYSCTLCDKSFNQKINLRRHIDMHTGTKPYSCTICKKLFSQNAHLIRHCEAYTGQKSYVCTLCEKSFHYKSEFTLHTKSHSGIGIGMHKYSCSICNKIFSKNSQLVLHIRTHTGEKPYSCTVCDKSFCQKVTLTRHMQTHTLIKPFICTVCPKTFSRKYVLTVHMRSHTSD